MRKDCLTVVLSLSLLCQLAFVSAKSGEDQWIWRSYSRRERAFRNKDNDRNGAIQNSYDNKLTREPTTRRPLPGEPENDEIEDYVDTESPVTSTPVGDTRQFNPYGNPNGFPGIGGQPPIGGQFGGQGGFPGGNPGVLVGQGGATRPHYNYPNVYQPNIGAFGGAQNGLGLAGYPGYFGGVGIGAGLGGTGLGGLGSAYPGLGGAGTAYPGLGASYGGFTGAQPGAGLGLGQFPGAGSQYPFGAYQGTGTNYNNNQFTAPGGQYPGLGQYPSNQYPSNQFPSNQYGGPQYPQGYGPPVAGNGPTGYGGNFGFGGAGGGFGYDESSRNGVEGKNAKSVSITAASVNDKLSKKD